MQCRQFKGSGGGLRALMDLKVAQRTTFNEQRYTMKQSILIFTVILFFHLQSTAQKPLDNAAIKYMVEKFKQDPRGPFKDIRWFCKDGTFVVPREGTCPGGGVQRARYKDEVVALAKSNHVFLGQILSTTPKEEFWDATNNNSRLKQYQLEKYLRSVEDGWVLRKAQFYRGAYQVEDEEAWGNDFFNWLLAKDETAIK